MGLGHGNDDSYLMSTSLQHAAKSYLSLTLLLAVLAAWAAAAAMCSQWATAAAMAQPIVQRHALVGNFAETIVRGCGFSQRLSLAVQRTADESAGAPGLLLLPLATRLEVHRRLAGSAAGWQFVERVDARHTVRCDTSAPHPAPSVLAAPCEAAALAQVDTSPVHEYRLRVRVHVASADGGGDDNDGPGDGGGPGDGDIDTGGRSGGPSAPGGTGGTGEPGGRGGRGEPGDRSGRGDRGDRGGSALLVSLVRSEWRLLLLLLRSIACLLTLLALVWYRRQLAAFLPADVLPDQLGVAMLAITTILCAQHQPLTRTPTTTLTLTPHTSPSPQLPRALT
jgi:hypothetical protein